VDLELTDAQRDLALALRAKLDGVADPDDVHGCLEELDLYALEVPAGRGGLGFGLGMGVVVCEELGRRAAGDDYRGTARARDEDEGGAERARWRDHTRQAAYLLGLAAGAHRLAVRRALTRRQFGQPLAEHQAIAFPLAAQLAHQEAVRLLVHRAAWLDEQGEPADRAALRALAYAAEQALETTAWAVHVHGAFGLTRYAPVSRYYTLAATEALRHGSPAALWKRAGA